MDPAQKRRIEIQAKKAKLAELKKLRGERQLSFPIARSTSGLGEGAAVSLRLVDMSTFVITHVAV